ncbi:MAG: 30S ribosomal protein S15 [Candidatus Bathyarchaeia archaeon]
MVKRRAHAHGRSHSVRPISRKPPAWSRYEPEEVEALITKLGRDLVPPSRIGLILRDQHGVPLAKQFTGKSVLQVLKEQRVAPAIPEDLQNLVTKATRLASHLERHKADSVNKHALQLIEARVHRLSRYYKRIGVLSPDWSFKAVVFSAK